AHPSSPRTEFRAKEKGTRCTAWGIPAPKRRDPIPQIERLPWQTLLHSSDLHNALPFYCGAVIIRIRQPAATTEGRRPSGGRTTTLRRSENLHARRQVEMACWAAFSLLRVLPTAIKDSALETRCRASSASKPYRRGTHVSCKTSRRVRSRLHLGCARLR